MADTDNSSSTTPTADQVAAAQQVIAEAAAASAAAEAARIKPVTDFVASSAAQQIRVALETLQTSFMNDTTYGVHINCALIGLKGLGVADPAAAAASSATSSTAAAS